MHTALRLPGITLCMMLFCNASKHRQAWWKPWGFCTNTSNTESIYCTQRITWGGRKQQWFGLRAVLQHRQITQALQQSAAGIKEGQKLLVLHLSRCCLLGGRSTSADYLFQWGNNLECLTANGPMPKTSPEMGSQPTSARCRKTTVSGEDR